VGDSCFPGQGVIVVAFSGTMCAHRVAADLGFEKRNAILHKGLSSLLAWFRTLA
jgi:prolycopene isomerase